MPTEHFLYTMVYAVDLFRQSRQFHVTQHSHLLSFNSSSPSPSTDTLWAHKLGSFRPVIGNKNYLSLFGYFSPVFFLPGLTVPGSCVSPRLLFFSFLLFLSRLFTFLLRACDGDTLHIRWVTKSWPMRHENICASCSMLHSSIFFSMFLFHLVFSTEDKIQPSRDELAVMGSLGRKNNEAKNRLLWSGVYSI
ncbi:hypothetical protein B0I35DRAFT_203140 [Stachybotrys elegans]|uniref:Uncharacterized protein n=1 Tax=Stachybotrys elegans TaxID=80388 RepID=A0A8K0SVI0_9HYPO|nr:hypothetical protein B0I35DRAFT_203140 [Stachybotrys elegans]